MEKAGTKRRDIHFKSDKNGIVVCVHSREAREYARYLEASADVASYEAGTVLDPDKYPFINTIGIRKEYFDTQWTSDFVIHFTEGNLIRSRIGKTVDDRLFSSIHSHINSGNQLSCRVHG